MNDDLRNRPARKYNLQERLIDFTIAILEISEQLPYNRIGNYYGGQLVRSGSSPSLNYGEAQSAESRKDFIHKLRVVLKELRETSVILRIIQKKPDLLEDSALLEKTLAENYELIAIMVKSIKTAKQT